jgi:Domain of unknown function (DUF4262)
MAPQGTATNQIPGNGTLERMRECHCQLCARAPSTEPLAAGVARRGWSVVSVPAEAPRPAYAFTVGLWHSFAHAEASVFGRDEREMVRWLDTVGGEVEAGRILNPDRQGDDILSSVEVFPRPALASWHRHLFGPALTFYQGQPVPMLQLVWPDDRGVLPWEPGCAAGCVAAQPWLWDRVTAAPRPTGWAFPVSPDALVLTTKAIAFDGAAVAGVVHDEEGEWQFLDDPAVDMGDLTIVHLAHVVSRRPELGAVGDLPAGFEAWRVGGVWSRHALDDLDP